MDCFGLGTDKQAFFTRAQVWRPPSADYAPSHAGEQACSALLGISARRAGVLAAPTIPTIKWMRQAMNGSPGLAVFRVNRVKSQPMERMRLKSTPFGKNEALQHGNGKPKPPFKLWKAETPNGALARGRWKESPGGERSDKPSQPIQAPAAFPRRRPLLGGRTDWDGAFLKSTKESPPRVLSAKFELSRLSRPDWLYERGFKTRRRARALARARRPCASAGSAAFPKRRRRNRRRWP